MEMEFETSYYNKHQYTSAGKNGNAVMIIYTVQGMNEEWVCIVESDIAGSGNATREFYLNPVSKTFDTRLEPWDTSHNKTQLLHELDTSNLEYQGSKVDETMPVKASTEKVLY